MSSHTVIPQNTMATRRRVLRSSTLPIPIFPPVSPNDTTLVDSHKEGESSDAPIFVPSKVSTVPFVEDNVKTEVEAIDIGTLKTRMKLDDWRCGGCTKEGKACRVQISEKRQLKILSLLDKILTLISSNGNLDKELQALILLVHCRYHDHGYAKEDRLELWAEVLSPSPTSFAITLERQIRKALRPIQQQCIGVNKKGKRCGQCIGGQRIHNCLKTVDEIVRSDVHENAELLQGFLEVLEANMYCHFHVSQRKYRQINHWKSTIMDIVEKSRPAPLASMIKGETQTHDREAVSKNDDDVNGTIYPTAQPFIPRKTRSLSPEFYSNPSEFWLPALDTGPWKQLPRLDDVPDVKACYELVHSTVNNELVETHDKKGYIYLYEVEGNEGLVKLGWTANLDKRLNEWTFSCNRKTKLLYPVSKIDTVMIPNAHRVEALCHAELDYCRIRVDCEGCMREHMEWFESTPGKCVQVIKKWSQWMRGEPYEKMRLRREEQVKTRDMEQFMTSVAMLV